MNDTATRLLWVCLGGAAGSGARYLISIAALRGLGSWLPWGTLLVNVVGSFALGLVVSLPAPALSPAARLALGAGLLGGFTTFSAFSVETLAYAERGQPGLAAAYAGGSVLLCLAAAGAGSALGRAV